MKIVNRALPPGSTLIVNQTLSSGSASSGHAEIQIVNQTLSATIPRDHLPQPKTEPRPFLIETKNQWERRIMIVPEYKLMFCWIDKVGGSMFQDIWRTLRMLHPDVEMAEKIFQGRRKKLFFRQVPSRFGLFKSDLEDLHTNPEWTKAVFFRDPATRFLSAFQSKCIKPMEEGGHTCRSMFQIHWLKNFTFDDAIDAVAANPSLVQNYNFHSMPHANFCGGLSNTLPYYDFVDQITESTSSYTIGKLLKRIGVNETLNNGITDCLVTRKDCTYLKSVVPLYAPDFQFPTTKSKTDTRASKHITGSNHGDTLLKNYKTNERLKIIQKAYQADYDLFHYEQLSLEESKGRSLIFVPSTILKFIVRAENSIDNVRPHHLTRLGSLPNNVTKFPGRFKYKSDPLRKHQSNILTSIYIYTQII